ncbi:helix-turn-helix domain-containing protein [Actinoplanes siamensis]|uniref:Transcriptional regulator n=1 Tax=Actinoplanes siamensis TaxID=1223317 RepID=A0A919NCV0_9ACTN|nr:helix-turn-helix transcriptional regulator [Actinoplanes siamensis]GIF08384.1 transcriptional regulator [Actinoplanes siamensis]
MASSPLVRRLRLAASLRQIRATAGADGGPLKAEELARRSGQNRVVISRLETGDRRPDVGRVMNVLEGLGLEEGSEPYRSLLRIARDAAATGWWDARMFVNMGRRMAQTANLESGAAKIREYHNSLLPGLVQTSAFARHLAEGALRDGAELDVEANLAGRARRQEILDPGGAEYEMILEVQAIQRITAPEPVLVEQLRHLLSLAQKPNIKMRVLPVDARLPKGLLPRAPFSMYDYTDPGDPTVVAVDTVTTDILLTEPADVVSYALMWARLDAAALSQEASVELVKRAADALAGKRSR